MNGQISGLIRNKLSKLHLYPKDVIKVGKYYNDNYIVTLGKRMENEINFLGKNISNGFTGFNHEGFDALYNLGLKKKKEQRII